MLPINAVILQSDGAGQGQPTSPGVHHLDSMGCPELHECYGEELLRHLPRPFLWTEWLLHQRANASRGTERSRQSDGSAS